MSGKGDVWLRLYPARYREGHGAEVVSVFREATACLSGRALLLERASLAAHALRLRARVGSADPVGRTLAAGAPLALAGMAGISLLYALDAVTSGASLLFGTPGATFAGTVIGLVDTLPAIAALICALTGRWSAARLLVLLATGEKAVLLSVIGGLQVYRPLMTVDLLLGTGVMGLLVLLAPPDLVDFRERGRRAVTVAMALLCVIPILVVNVLYVNRGGASPLVYLEPAWPALIPAAVVLVALVGRRPDRLRAIGAGLAALPWTAVLADPFTGLQSLALTACAVCAPLLAAVVIAAAIRVLRPRAVAQPLDPA